MFPHSFIVKPLTYYSILLFAYPRISYKLNYIECTLLCLASYFQHNNFGIHPCFNINCSFLKWIIRIAFYKHITMFKNLLFFKKILYFIYLFLAVLGLHFCARTFSSCSKQGPLFILVRGPLTIAASLVAEHRLQTCRLNSCGSRA